MKSYEKPVVLANDEVAEGVYAASGAEGTACFKFESDAGRNWSTGDGFYEYNVRFRHIDEAHMNCTHKFIIHFSATPIAVSCSTNCKEGTQPEIKGNSIIVTWQQQQANGGGEVADIGLKVKWADGVKGVPTGGYGWRV